MAKSAKTVDKNTSGSLSTVVEQLKKEFGEGAIMTLGGDQAPVQVAAISTGAFSLDIALGVGGLPRGRVVEVYGPESSGKTTLCMHVIASAQKAGGTAAFIDAEHAMDPGYCEKIGVNLDELLVSQPSSGEEALTITETLVRSNALDLVVIDSVAALVPRAELEGNMGDAHVGLQARLMSQALRKLTAVIAQTKTLCIFTNQIREKIGVMFGSPETTPGGRALKFYSSVRLDIRRIGMIKDNTGNVLGNHTRVKVVKNKVAAPFREAEFDILYAQGISWAGSVLETAIKHELVEKRGSWLAYDGQQLGQGQDASRVNLEKDPELLEKIIADVKAKVANDAKPAKDSVKNSAGKPAEAPAVAPAEAPAEAPAKVPAKAGAK
ncbi:MAG: recombinase RecA [Verrucomicrobia bacterium]|nr:recombinase RecA [Verrucomicrobiota bacterium]MDA1087961.1 recombinase RecA [Verrucomicrobiota bacterium]